MLLRMTKRSAGRSTAAPREPTSHPLSPTRDVIVNNDRRGCTYKEFLACKPKEYDGKGGKIAYTHWIEKMESVQDMSGCGDNKKVKYTARSFVDFKNLTREKFCPVNEIQKLETEFWNHTMVGTGHAAYTYRLHDLEREPSRDKNVKDDNKRTRTENAFAITTNLVRREYTGTTPMGTNCNLHHSHESPCRACFSCNCLGHLVKDCRMVPRIMNPMNARNLITAHGACFECSGTDHFKAACPRLNQAQRPGGGRPNQVVAIDGGQGRGKMTIGHVEEHSCWGQRRLARTRTS
nr:reverse transcriptase domain-containing protein [Tanacetum cinerariifolium]